MTEKQTKIMVQVHPNAGKNVVVRFNDNILQLKIAAPPVEGKANQELVKFLSKLLDIRKSDISIDKGTTGRRKIITIYGIEHDEIEKRLALVQDD
jgi:uncharacterized protein (TIGR00251 family)